MAMEKDELLKKIEKKQQDIEKINKRLAKAEEKLKNSEAAFIKKHASIYPNYQIKTIEDIIDARYDMYQKSKYSNDVTRDSVAGDIQYWYERYVEDIEDDIKRAKSDLEDAQEVVKKYQVAIDKIDNFAKEEKIKVIWDFLTEWENKAFNWYLVNAEHYFELKKNYKKEWENQKSKYIERYGQRYEYRAERVFEEDYYYGIDNLTQNITSFTRNYENGTYVYTDYSVDKEKLSKILKQEKERKYKDLINRVTKVTGIITDASRLEISPKGNLDGIVVGEKGKAKVETISAGGWNIQVWHWRTLIHPIK